MESSKATYLKNVKLRAYFKIIYTKVNDCAFIIVHHNIKIHTTISWLTSSISSDLTF